MASKWGEGKRLEERPNTQPSNFVLKTFGKCYQELVMPQESKNLNCKEN